MKSTESLLEWDALVAVLADHAQSELGRALVRRMRPLPSLSSWQETAAAVAEGTKVLEEGDPPLRALGRARDLGPILEAAHQRGAALEVDELNAVLRTLEAARLLRGMLAGREDCPALRSRSRGLSDLAEVIEPLRRSVSGGKEVPDSASPELAEVRAELRKRERSVRLLAEQITGRPGMRTVLREGPPVSRGGRLMLAVKAESRGNVRGLLHDHSASGNTAFIEPEELVEPQNQLAELLGREQRLVTRILLDLTRAVLRHEGEIREQTRIVAALDAVFARSLFGRVTGGTLIQVGDDGVLSLRRVYHPLLLERERAESSADTVVDLARAYGRARDRVVPFDLELGGASDGLLLTGPNTGGKTVTLKAAGLVSLMAMAAVPAPVAAGGRVPWLVGVHADIGDEQDLQQSLSTFSGHLRRVAEILRTAQRGALVLLDEVGTGTDPQEGEALSRALLETILDRGCLLLATTHLSGLKELGYQHPRLENASLEFDVKSLSPLYHLTLGIPGQSNALTIARRHGIPEAIVAAAQAHLDRHQGAERRDVQRDVERARRAARDHLDAAEHERRELEAARDQLQQELAEVQARNEMLDQQKDAEIERVLTQVRSEGHRLVNELGTVPKGLAARVDRIRMFLDTLSQRSSLSERRHAYAASRRRDDVVYLPRYRERCRVRRVDRDKKIVEVNYGGMALEISFDEIACPDDYSGSVGDG